MQRSAPRVSLAWLNRLFPTWIIVSIGQESIVGQQGPACGLELASGQPCPIKYLNTTVGKVPTTYHMPAYIHNGVLTALHEF